MIFEFYKFRGGNYSGKYGNLIFNSFNEYNRRLKNSSNKLIKSQGNTIAKENIIIGLRKDLEYHKDSLIKLIRK